MKVLDIACGSGGSAIGYAMAGCSVLGVDVAPMPRFPFGFLQCDAMDLDDRFLRFFDLVHASPPCQRFTALRHAKGAKGDANPDLIAPLREKFRRAGVHYVIENVPGAPLIEPTMLCGSMFGLGVKASETFYQLQRHRLFETNWPLTPPIPRACRHIEPVIGVYGGHVRCRSAKHGGRRTLDFEGFDKSLLARSAMGIPAQYSMTMGELSEAIPPAFTRFVAESFMLWAARQKAAA